MHALAAVYRAEGIIAKPSKSPLLGMQEGLHQEALKTVEAIKTVSTAPWWLKAVTTEDAQLLMQKPADILADSLRLSGGFACPQICLTGNVTSSNAWTLKASSKINTVIRGLGVLLICNPNRGG